MKLIGEGALRARLKAIGQTELLMREIVIHGVTEAKALVPRKTGHLFRTIRPGRVDRHGGEIKAGGTRLVGYARAVELGSGPHVIRPRKAKVLAWGGSRRLSGSLRTGSRPTHFARKVNHPGSRAKPYLRPGLQKAAEQFGIAKIVQLWNGAS